MLIDTHAHLYWDSYKKDFSEVIQRCKAAGITTVINVGVDIEKSRIAAELESDQIKFYATVGIHPHEAYKYEDQTTLDEDIKALEEIYEKNSKKVVAIGEIGLDYFFQNSQDFNPNNLSDEDLKNLQRKLFKSQIDLAKELDLPLIVHCRDDRSKNPENIECWKECLDMISGYKGILHCYSGTLPITRRTMNNELTNFLVSFAGNITYPKNNYLREAAQALPLEKICLETDSPFLAPQSIRGQRNEPSSVKEIAELLAQIKGVSFDEVAEKTSENVQKVLRLS